MEADYSTTYLGTSLKTLARSVQQAGAVGEEVTTPWREINDIVTLRTKELLIIGGGPGGGKSTLAVNLAQQVDYPVLYFAQDSAPSVISRLAALQLGHKTEAVASRLTNPEEQEQIAKVLQRYRKTLVLETGSVTIDHIEDCTKALIEWLGKAPTMVILDNLIDLNVPGHTYNDTIFYATALPALKQMALKYDTIVMVLHHVTRSGEGKKHGLGNQPIKLSDLLYAGERTARHVWGCHTAGDNEIRVQILKQQDGPADPEGREWVGLRWLPAYARLVGR